jgi:hypothetical protein
VTAQIEFFADARDEAFLLKYLDRPPAIPLPSSIVRSSAHFAKVDLAARPAFEDNWAFYLWFSPAGMLQWFSKEPVIDTSSHADIVSTFAAQRSWQALAARGASEMLDAAHSPVQAYRRGVRGDHGVLPALLLAPQPRLRDFGVEFERWVTRTHSWVRRHAQRVHHWDANSNSIPNPMSLMNTIYALPGAFEVIATGSHPYTIS